jgi:2-keto-4-pentenoate hydratase
MADPTALAQELTNAYGSKTIVPAPSSREGGIDLGTAYAVEAAIADARRASGHRTVGWKVGYADKAMWRALELETLAWAHMYDDTVSYADWLRIETAERELAADLGRGARVKLASRAELHRACGLSR